MTKTLLIGLFVISTMSGTLADDHKALDSYGMPVKNNTMYWRHQAVYSFPHSNDPKDPANLADPDSITNYERLSCNHRVAYPYAYCAPPCEASKKVYTYTAISK